MKLEDYNEYYIQGSDHYLIPKDVFKELFNEKPYLQETDKEYEDVNGNTYFIYKEYVGKELLDILKEVSE